MLAFNRIRIAGDYNTGGDSVAIAVTDILVQK